MANREEGVRASIPEDVRLRRVTQSEQMREFFVQLWLQNPALAKRTGRRIADMLVPLDHGGSCER